MLIFRMPLNWASDKDTVYVVSLKDHFFMVIDTSPQLALLDSRQEGTESIPREEQTAQHFNNSGYFYSGPIVVTVIAHLNHCLSFSSTGKQN